MMMNKNLLASVLLAAGFAFGTSAMAADYLADRHAQLGLKCAQCHGEKGPSKPPTMDPCLKCHGGSYEEVAKTTAEKHPNPHYTHQGDKECAVCHKGHKASEFFCNECHKFKVQVP
jgi:hypothetical protein